MDFKKQTKGQSCAQCELIYSVKFLCKTSISGGNNNQKS